MCYSPHYFFEFVMWYQFQMKGLESDLRRQTIRRNTLQAEAINLEESAQSNSDMEAEV